MPDSWRPRRDRLERISRTQLSMTPGDIGGRVAEAAPIHGGNSGNTDASADIEAVFSYPGRVRGDESPAYINRSADTQIGTVIGTILAGTSGATTFTVYVNGSAVGSVAVPAGSRQHNETVFDDGPVLDYGDMITVKATTIGGGASNASVQVLIEEI